MVSVGSPKIELISSRLGFLDWGTCHQTRSRLTSSPSCCARRGWWRGARPTAYRPRSVRRCVHSITAPTAPCTCSFATWLGLRHAVYAHPGLTLFLLLPVAWRWSWHTRGWVLRSPCCWTASTGARSMPSARGCATSRGSSRTTCSTTTGRCAATWSFRCACAG